MMTYFNSSTTICCEKSRCPFRVCASINLSIPSFKQTKKNKVKTGKGPSYERYEWASQDIPGRPEDGRPDKEIEGGSVVEMLSFITKNKQTSTQKNEINQYL